MLTDRKRVVGSVCLVATGAILLAYGGGLHAIDVLVPKEAEKPAVSPEVGPPPTRESIPPTSPEVVAKSEWAVVLDVSAGGLVRDRAGQVKQTYKGTTPPKGKGCPT